MIFRQELPMSIPEELSYMNQCRQPLGRISTDLRKIFSQGPARDQGHLGDFTSTASRSSYKNLYKIILRPLTAFH